MIDRETNELAGVVVMRRAPAKINWYLRVLGKRPDGFHELDSLVSEIALYDDLEFSRSARGMTLECDHADVPTDERNLILRAISELRLTSGTDDAVSCRLTKRIPMGGGLGGGSSNAATTLLAVNELLDLGLTRDTLVRCAAQLGSDVTFFLFGGTAYMRGRGEIIEPADPPWQGWILLLMPDFTISTADVYRAWTPVSNGRERETFDMRPATSAREWLSRLFNMLEAPARQVCERLGPLMDAARELAARPVHLSGSGSCMFTAYDEQGEAERAARELERRLQVTCRPVQLHAPERSADRTGN